VQATVNQQPEIVDFRNVNLLKEVPGSPSVQFGGPMFALDYCDQAGARPPITTGAFRWSEGASITARLLIAERVRREFERFDARGSELPMTLVTMSANGRAMTLDETIETALGAFSANRFFLLVDRRQIVDLDAPFLLTPKSTVVFVRLTPLKGG
jgi:hypothetical protein